MAKVVNAATTYAAKGNREALANAIYNIDPSDRPFMTLIGERDTSNRTFDWQTEKLPTVNTGNAQQEGFELARSAATMTTRATNVTQISSRDVTVSGSQEAADAAGKRGEMAHQMALIGKALLRDMESILCSAQARVDGEDSTPTARKTRAFEHWITTNATYGTGGAAAVSATAALTDGSAYRLFTENLLGQAMETAYTNGAEPTVMLMGPWAKRKFSTFTGRAAARFTADADEIIGAADYYLSDFGEIKCLPSRWVRPRTILGIDPGYAKTVYYRRLKKTDIATIGDADTKMLVVEYGLEVSNEAAHFKLADIQPTSADAAT